MKVIICSGNDFKDWEKTLSALDYWHERLRFSLIIHRGLPLVQRWAELRRVTLAQELIPTDEQKRLGADLEPIRNRRMIDKYNPGRVIAFSGGAETRDMVNQARAAAIRVIEVA